MAEFFAREGIREMQFDERQFHCQQCVAQRHAGVRQAAGVDDRETDAIGLGGLNPVDELVLGIALEGDQLVPKAGSGVLRALFYLGQGVRAKYHGFALAKQDEIRAVK